MKEYRVGLLGYGFIGKVHAFAHRNLPFFYNPLPFRSRIVKVATGHEATAHAAAEQLGDGVVGTTDWLSVVNDPDIDILDICSPNEEHLAALLPAMRRQLPIYCEKPLVGNDSAQESEIATALANYHAVSQMTLIYRFFPNVLRALELVKEGRIGDILEFHASFLHSGSVDPNAPCGWKVAAGVIADLGSHVLDLVETLTGPFATIQSRTYHAYDHRPKKGAPEEQVAINSEDSMCCLITLPNGACGTVSASKIATGAEDEMSVEIYGTKGAIRIRPMNIHQIDFFDQSIPEGVYGGSRGWVTINCGARYPQPAGFPTAKSLPGWLRGHVHCLYNFMNGVHTNTHVHPDLKDGLHLQSILTKVRCGAR
jgi:predicted dehydrogenase